MNKADGVRWRRPTGSIRHRALAARRRTWRVNPHIGVSGEGKVTIAEQSSALWAFDGSCAEHGETMFI